MSSHSHFFPFFRHFLDRRPVVWEFRDHKNFKLLGAWRIRGKILWQVFSEFQSFPPAWNNFVYNCATKTSIKKKSPSRFQLYSFFLIWTRNLSGELACHSLPCHVEKNQTKRAETSIRSLRSSNTEHEAKPSKSLNASQFPSRFPFYFFLSFCCTKDRYSA